MDQLFIINVIYCYSLDEKKYNKTPLIYRKIAISKLALIPKLIETVLDVYELDQEYLTDYTMWVEHPKTGQKIWSIGLEQILKLPSFKRKNLNIKNLLEFGNEMCVITQHKVPHFFYLIFEGSYTNNPTNEVINAPKLIEKKGDIFY